MDQDLFGNPILPASPVNRSPVTGKKRCNTRANGYAARPGTGPQGETCKSCRHKHANEMHSGRVFWKCGLMKHCWTGGRGSDVLMSSPACSRWEKADFCQCRKADAWRCATDQNLSTVACSCACHRQNG